MTAGAAAQLAGLLWVLQWAHALVAHGPTQVNQAQLWLGMTWLDSAKLLAVAYLLLVPAVLAVVRALQEAGDRRARAVGALGIATLVVCAATTLLEFRSAWGSYAGAFGPSDRLAHVGGVTRSLASSVVLTVVLVVLAVRAGRRHVLPSWLAPVLAVGCVTTYFLGGPLPPVAGLGWLVLGGCLLARGRPAASYST